MKSHFAAILYSWFYFNRNVRRFHIPYCGFIKTAFVCRYIKIFKCEVRKTVLRFVRLNGKVNIAVNAAIFNGYIFRI